MKLPEQEFETLKAEIQAYAANRQGFGTRGLRDYWDAFAAVMSARDAREFKSGWSHYYKTLGLNDAHIETALRRIANA